MEITLAYVQLALGLIALIFALGNMENRLPLWPAIICLAAGLIIAGVR